jgi:hypothetical protein
MSWSKPCALIVGLWLTSTSSSARAEDPEDGPQVAQALLVEERVKGNSANWQPALERALKTLNKLLNRGTPRRFGFKTKPDVEKLNVLAPLPQALIQVSDLRRYRKGQQAAALLRPTDRLIFPLLVGDRVSSSLTLARTSNTWQPVAFGSAALIRRAMSTRLVAERALGPNTNQPLLLKGRAADYTIVNVTGLNRYFLAARGPAGLYLIPFSSDKRVGLTADVPELAEEVLMKLVPAARLHNGLPT